MRPQLQRGRDLGGKKKVSPFRAKAGAKFIDYSNDENHNRLVVTVGDRRLERSRDRSYRCKQ